MPHFPISEQFTPLSPPNNFVDGSVQLNLAKSSSVQENGIADYREVLADHKSFSRTLLTFFLMVEVLMLSVTPGN